MGYWGHIIGTIKVWVPGRTQAECQYILSTVLNHLPRVPELEVHANQRKGYSSWCSQDELGNQIPIEYQEVYLLSIAADTKGVMFDELFRGFNKWLTRLAKRLVVLELLIQVEDDFGKSCIINDACAYRDINEPFMSDERSGGEPAWVEYLMWERAKDDWMPMLLKYKYYQDDENDKEVERRIKERKENHNGE